MFGKIRIFTPHYQRSPQTFFLGEIWSRTHRCGGPKIDTKSYSLKYHTPQEKDKKHVRGTVLNVFEIAKRVSHQSLPLRSTEATTVMQGGADPERSDNSGNPRK
ncbi:hypothetical protein RRG08_020615 [Elysia crispata]|uniref:Uncharacterized protein n=1 Tax=Elysia crispata TaxID=231223 RepID=A0AAE0YQK9_9GAST|nr:hypothetical protein RRG08_020615 [Elysia crispata]